MLSEYQKFQIKRWWRRRLRSVHRLRDTVIHTVNESIFKPMTGFKEIRRFSIGWVGIVVLIVAGLIIQSGQLDAEYKQTIPKEGGVFSEGIVGELSNFNPLFASGNANQAAARLMFSSLYKYDHSGQLIPDLAKEITVAKDDITYTVKLRDDVFWHDGVRLTAKDVVFTFKTIQNPEARSPLLDSWKDIQIREVSKHVVEFKLPNKFAPFQYSLTSSIVPEHILSKLDVTELRTTVFNQAPVGSGPFVFKGLDAEKGKLELVRNEDYHNGAPYLNRFILTTFEDQTDLDRAIQAGELTAIADVSSNQENIPSDYQRYRLPLSNSVFSFFNTSRPPLNDLDVRKALAESINRDEILDEVQLPDGASRSPLLVEHIGYDPKLVQTEIGIQEAAKYLNEKGWVSGSDGVRVKGDQRLKLTITSQTGGEFPKVTQKLASTWRSIGAEVEINLLSLDELRKERIVSHDYDVLLFGIAMGSDPDVFAYWHSSQREEGGFNLSEYQSAKADDALEAGRTRLDPNLRAAKYRAFTQTWLSDTPAVALYRTSLNYVQDRSVTGFQTRRIIDPADRFNNVEDWAVTSSEAVRK